MNVATQTASRVHHLRSISHCFRMTPVRKPSLRSAQAAELLADAVVEARARQLRQAADRRR